MKQWNPWNNGQFATYRRVHYIKVSLYLRREKWDTGPLEYFCGSLKQVSETSVWQTVGDNCKFLKYWCCSRHTPPPDSKGPEIKVHFSWLLPDGWECAHTTSNNWMKNKCMFEACFWIAFFPTVHWLWVRERKKIYEYWWLFKYRTSIPKNL